MNSIQRVLIANRGEISLRIIRACKELGIETIQVYSEADRGSLAVQLADRSVCIGPSRSAESYLRPEALISAALSQEADAIHPGYGYLSENAKFASLCQQQNVTFIGPRPEVIGLMGNKARARQIAAEAGVPTTPGSSEPVADMEEVKQVAEKIGFPLLLKASAGGGGKGMRVVSKPEELEDLFEHAKSEAKAAFADDDIYIEKYLTDIRHIEVQILADETTVLHLGERDCTIQRRNQKLVEESPSPALSQQLRAAITEAAVRLAEKVGYTSTGTVEFILDEKTKNFYFMEMNTRIQVEHPVTEMVTGLDLVKEQIQIASGHTLKLTQEEVQFMGHAIECRINAEDYQHDFMPCPGKITRYVPPGGIGLRVDSHVYTNYQIPPYYDSLLGKIIAWGFTREEAVARIRRALEELVIEGVTTTAPFYQELMNHKAFIDGQFNTGFVQDHILSFK